jgi:hypothetical protein
MQRENGNVVLSKENRVKSQGCWSFKGYKTEGFGGNFRLLLQGRRVAVYGRNVADLQEEKEG